MGVVSENFRYALAGLGGLFLFLGIALVLTAKTNSARRLIESCRIPPWLLIVVGLGLVIATLLVEAPTTQPPVFMK